MAPIARIPSAQVRRWVTPFLLVCASAGWSVAQAGPTDEPARAPRVLIPHAQEAWVRAQVRTVSPAQRLMGLDTADGPIELRVSDAIQRLDDVRVGDWLDIRYQYALAIAIRPAAAGVRERWTDVAEGRAPAGSPAGAGYIAETIVVDVERVDSALGLIRVRGPLGRREQIRIMDTDVMRKIQVGDQLEIRYELAVAVEFRAAPPTSR